MPNIYVTDDSNGDDLDQWVNAEKNVPSKSKASSPATAATASGRPTDDLDHWVAAEKAQATPAAPAQPAGPIGGQPFTTQPASPWVAATSGFAGGIPVIGPYLARGAAMGAAGLNSLLNGAPYQPEAYEAAQAQSAIQYPRIQTAGQIGGGIAGTGMMMAAAPGAFGVGASNPFYGSLASTVTGAGVGGLDAAARGGNAGDIATGAAVNGAFGLAAPWAGQAVGALGRGLGNAFVGTVDPETAMLAQAARLKYGIPVNTGQMSASPGVRYASSAFDRLPMSGAEADVAAQRGAFNNAVAGTFGETASGKITPAVINSAQTRIGAMFDTVAANTKINVDPQFQTDLQNALLGASHEANAGAMSKLYNLFDEITSKIDASGTIDGAQYQALTRANSPLGRALRSQDTDTAHWAGEIKEALDDVLQRSAPPDMQDMLTTARQQYRNLKTVIPLAAKAPTGDISPALLAGAINTSKYSKNALAYGGGGDLGELARIGQRFLKEPPSSGTSERLTALGIAKDVGYAGLGLAGLQSVGVTPEHALMTLGAIPAGLAAGRGVGAALRSNWLANSLINRSLYPGAIGAGPGAAGANLLTRSVGPQIANPNPLSAP